ncbi:indolepyruvate ferredoxin oxidoreductase family protein [Sphingomonas sp. MG17]|uniref:Indolepyruvate ferredoxin oxidoreductase family protein n=1 Tax=Sphingomonas tagetis TaxID=2949092 RepID=A0A9X2KMS5_9SPHN|nr:indolepyruvate ferredoxin oxidoreductase family protein [Sphingomonas tagetis]MCP3732115.1 indolepyruvate ferredoxin oxidoreductase family protein [Sphingomonas tagetis]
MDRYDKRDGRILISGVQALVRLMLLQAERDQAQGVETGGYVSGYRGSPLGTLDTAFASAATQAASRGIIVQPAVNEELAATAVAGSQQIAQTSGAQVQGVFSLWYGKGPGFDRASDALRHGNYQGTSEHGGVVLAIGDDHVAKSSSIICRSDEIAAALAIPLFYPADPAEIIELGLHAFAMSRYSGSYAALKIITEVADSTRAIDAATVAIDPILPERDDHPLGYHNRWPETPLEQEERQVRLRLPAVAAYVRANRLDRIISKPPNARIGLIASGKSWHDLRSALELLGLTDARLTALGIALYKPALIWPLEAEGLAEFADGLGTLLVVEEKDGFVEGQAKQILYNRSNGPAIYGKQGPDGRTWLSATGDLTPEDIAHAVGTLVAALTGDVALRAAAADTQRLLEAQARFTNPPAIRKPFFCSGCPHNRSTALPVGSRATAGIGCHGLAAYNRPFTGSFAQMGGEGVHWMGLSPFTSEQHIFANMGDGTYFHSGLLAVRQAVAARLNITFKLLYNDAVAMTGGQSVDGDLSVDRLIDQLAAEGVGTIAIASDDSDRRRDAVDARKVAKLVHRDDFEALQLEMRDLPGVSVIIYEQMCATEKRRLRKRGRMADTAPRVFINELVCEGCGDCSVKSNCLSVEPVETEFGVKRKINQSSCNKDQSCVTGFCPSFVTVKGGRLKPPAPAAFEFDGKLPRPRQAAIADERIMVAGVGGTGVVTISALLGMSGHLLGKQVGMLDQVGMAQKGGAVVSHVRVADSQIAALRIEPEGAGLILICDEIVGNSRDVMAAVRRDATHVLVNTDVSITGDFVRDRDARPDTSFLTRRLRDRVGEGRLAAYPFTQLADRLLGDAIGSNLMMVGFAAQKGWLGVDLAAIDGAIVLNGTAVESNRAALAIGRQLAEAPDQVLRAADLDALPTNEDPIARRAAFLTNYQNQAYAARYLATVDRVADAEAAIGTGGELTRAVSRSLFRLMAYKDEYEVARLYTDGSFAAALKDNFEGDFSLTFHLAPPAFARRDEVSGHLRKRAFGGWLARVLPVLARGRRLRGSPFDPFGYSAERRKERSLIVDYERLVDTLLAGLGPATIGTAVRIAAMAEEIRGYGHVKEAAIATYEAAIVTAIADYVDAPPVPVMPARSVSAGSQS